ncbi:MAG: hypothetical protein LQ345_002894 [Seirophora villosa]|nr:MAG: hypothetical protein LQ345_002894 [Seirophora villosa]
MEQPHTQLLAYMQDPLSLLVHQDSAMPKKPQTSATNLPTAQHSHTRRRTSPSDQAVLEAAYKDNPKPDKATRTELCLKIWFQNKRQVQRRRSRPMTAENMSTALHCSQDSAASSTPSYPASSQEFLVHEDPTSSVTSQSAIASDHKTLSSQDVNDDSTTNKPGVTLLAVPAHQGEAPLSTATLTSFDDREASSNAPQGASNASHGDPLAMPGAMTPMLPASTNAAGDTGIAYLHVSQADHSTPPYTLSTPPLLAPNLKRTLSQPRLSTSLNGSVRVATGTSPSPSPPRPQRSALQRSHSSAVSRTSAPAGYAALFGRSRDSRTWEFYCDRGGREELTQAAELETTGSATAAIALMRSSSKECKSVGANPTVPNKRNAGPRKSDSSKRPKNGQAIKTSKPKLSRATSSLARLQSSTNTASNFPKQKSALSRTEVAAATIDDKDMNKKGFIDIYDEGNESDKENWLPGTQLPATPRRRHRDARRDEAAILQEASSIPSISGTSLRSGINTGNTGHGANGKYGEDTENDDEIVRFMSGGGSGSVAVGESEDEEDLAGVHGLLSLSQGAWR